MLSKDGQYEPLTEEQWRQFVDENPDLARYFDNDNDYDETNPNPTFEELDIPEVPE